MTKIGAFIKDLIIIVLLALALAVILKTFVVDSRIIPSASMHPTVQINDRILINKFIYRFEDVERGDIIVFKPNADTGETRDMLKRVIGLPGETVEIKNNQVYINDTPLEEAYLAETPAYQFGPVTIPDDCVFVLGDNRNKSADAHVWLNPYLGIDQIKGKAFCIYWPINHMRSLN